MPPETETEKPIDCLLTEILLCDWSSHKETAQYRPTAVMCTPLSLNPVCFGNYFVKPDAVSQHTLLFIIVYAGGGRLKQKKEPFSMKIT